MNMISMHFQISPRHKRWKLDESRNGEEENETLRFPFCFCPANTYIFLFSQWHNRLCFCSLQPCENWTSFMSPHVMVQICEVGKRHIWRTPGNKICPIIITDLSVAYFFVQSTGNIPSAFLKTLMWHGDLYKKYQKILIVYCTYNNKYFKLIWLLLLQIMKFKVIAKGLKTWVRP